MRYSLRALTCSLAVAFLATPLAVAHADLITNGGFEAGQLGGAGYYDYVAGGSSATRDSWTYSVPSPNKGGVLIRTGGGSPWVSGSQTGYGGTQVAGIEGISFISQSFSAVYTGTYSIDWLDAGRGTASAGNQTYIVTLYDNTANLLAASSATLTTTSNSNFSARNFSGLLTAGDSYTLTFTGQSTGDQTALIDNVSVNQVPEPATLSLLGAGLAGLGWVRRRKRA